MAIERAAMRMESHELAERLRVAVNADELSERVREAQHLSLDHMRTYTRAALEINVLP